MWASHVLPIVSPSIMCPQQISKLPTCSVILVLPYSMNRKGVWTLGRADLTWSGPRTAGSAAFSLSGLSRGHCTWEREGRAEFIYSEDSSRRKSPERTCVPAEGREQIPGSGSGKGSGHRWSEGCSAAYWLGSGRLAGRRAVTAVDRVGGWYVHTADSRY